MIRHVNICIIKTRRRLNVSVNILFRVYYTFLHVTYVIKEFKRIEISKEENLNFL